MILDAEPIRLIGPLTHTEVAELYREGLPDFSSGLCSVDLSRVEQADSAALGLLLAWQRAAQRANSDLKLIAVPENILCLAKLYGVAEALHLPTTN